MKEENFNLVQNLNQEQRFIYNQILEEIESKQNNLFFIYGYGDTGKTYYRMQLLVKLE